MSVLSTNIYKLSFNPSHKSVKKLELNNYLKPIIYIYRLCEKTAPHLHKPRPHFDISGQELQLNGIKTELNMDIFIFLGEHYQHTLLLTLFGGSKGSQCSWLSWTSASSCPAAPCLWACAGRDEKHFTTNSSKQALQLQIFQRKLKLKNACLL